MRVEEEEEEIDWNCRDGNSVAGETERDKRNKAKLVEWEGNRNKNGSQKI